MADFCSLCGYIDLDVQETYDKFLKPKINVEKLKKMENGKLEYINLNGLCEHCGIFAFGINNKLEAEGIYCGEAPHIFGHVDEETLELIILENDPKYNKARKSMDSEMTHIKFEMALYDLYCLKHETDRDSLSSKDYEIVGKIYDGILVNINEKNPKAFISTIEKELEEQDTLITEAVGDIITIATINDYDNALELIKNQFIVIDKQDLKD